MPPTGFWSYFNPHIVPVDSTLADQPSLYWDSDKALDCSFVNSCAPNGNRTPKSSTELMEEIATLELEIMHLEHHLLILYRTAFQGCTYPSTPESHLQFKAGQSKLELQMHSGGLVKHDQASPGHRHAGSDTRNSAMKEPPKRDRKSAYTRRLSLADHLRDSRDDNTLNSPDRLSEDIVRCISSVYCKLANPKTHPCLSASPTSSLSSSSIFSSKNPGDSWSPHCNEDATTHYQGLTENRWPYATMIEVLKLCLDNESFNYASMMLQNFRSLVRRLEKVDIRKMKREEKLVFWINIHNALVMHAYLAYGTQTRVKSTSVLKHFQAAYNIGGHCINAYIIQTSILGIRAHHSAPWLQTLFHSGRKVKTGSIRHVYTLEYPEPLVHFALCSGAYSDPAIRAYSAKSIFQDLKLAKTEFIQASVYMYQETKLFLPKILEYFAKDMSLDMVGLLENIDDCLPDIHKKAIRSRMQGKLDKYINWLPQSSTFRYVIHEELAAKVKDMTL